MISSTVDKLSCPRRKRAKAPCGGSLKLIPKQKLPNQTSSEVFEVRSGSLECTQCQSRFPILAGVAILVDDVRTYLLTHTKGIAQSVPDSEIPKEFLHEFLEAKSEIQREHIEEDLEAERVNSLYVMNHYLRVQDTNSTTQSPWWKPEAGSSSSSSPSSPLIDSLIRTYWDQGPFHQIKVWMEEIAQQQGQKDVVELGCGVGGLYPTLKAHLRSYLGVDSSFASIALARHIALGFPYRGSTLIPSDLIQGPISRKVHLPIAENYDGHADFLVGDFESPPLKLQQWDLAIALNAIDMLDVPAQLPELKFKLLKKNGLTIQSCPYVWHEAVARKLRSKLPKDIRDSAQAAEWLYKQSGFNIKKSIPHLPWLFFKHLRQIEIYSVHLFLAEKIFTPNKK